MTKEKRAYYATRKRDTLNPGIVYENEGGGFFRCLRSDPTVDAAIMKNIKSGWTFMAHGIGIYIDGRIDWDYSTGGRFEEVTA